MEVYVTSEVALLFLFKAEMEVLFLCIQSEMKKLYKNTKIT